ncbi:leucine-rich repeat-containing protein 23-like [Adelges cooleyi]|uniref:leucine-rich repeat-containing protein 23-like n=1 Tax=Adelges cooleyi TaxID=133065 RepID=UPI002180774B|nr:leucine-rich repeat-containing protein 23-like [Adelges cooleyi]
MDRAGGDVSNVKALPKKYRLNRKKDNSTVPEREEDFTDGGSAVISEMFPDAKEWYEGEYEEECVYDEYKRYHNKKSLVDEDALPKCVLTVEEAGKCLTRIGQVAGSFDYAFLQIDAVCRELTNIEVIPSFKFLSFVNVSCNYLDLEALDVLKGLENALIIYADHNSVESLHLTSMPYLKVLTLNFNRVSSLSGLKQPSLECLSLNENHITTIVKKPEDDTSFKEGYFNGIDCPKLIALSICKNTLTSMENISLVSTKLRILYLRSNKIVTLKGIEGLVNLKRLHLRCNCISNLNGFTDKMKNLTYLNIRENLIANVHEIKKLKCLESLETLVVKSNGFNDDDQKPGIRLDVIRILPWLKRLDKEMVTESEVMEVTYMDKSSEEEYNEQAEDEEEYLLNLAQ